MTPTPLQQAAQSALDRYESVRYGSLITPQVIESQMLDLSKALEAEQAQAVEPAIYQSRMRPTWLDEGIGWTPWECCSKDSFENYTKTPNIHDWQYDARALFTHPAPPPAGERDHVENNLNMVGERAELIAVLRSKYRDTKQMLPVDYCHDAADMLEDDAAAYDQQALELCPECGWKAIMPGEPCFVCNMHIEAQQVAVPLRECHYESPTLRVCNKCGQRHDKAIFASQGAKP